MDDYYDYYYRKDSLLFFINNFSSFIFSLVILRLFF